MRTVIDELLRNYLASPESNQPREREWVHRFSALPITSDNGEIYGLLPSGTVIYSKWDASEVQTLRDERLIRAVLSSAARRYNPLKPYAPRRPEDATPCPLCGYTVAEECTTPGALCFCGDLGWIKPSELDAAASCRRANEQPSRPSRWSLMGVVDALEMLAYCLAGLWLLFYLLTEFAGVVLGTGSVALAIAFFVGIAATVVFCVRDIVRRRWSPVSVAVVALWVCAIFAVLAIEASGT